MSEIVTGGSCYSDAYRWMIQNTHFGNSAKLIHATVTGHAPIEGIEYGHAFILINDGFVIDVATGKEKGFSKDEYYKTGQVKEVKEYTIDEMYEAAVNVGTYGPWCGRWFEGTMGEEE
tara:strand:+ start:813 stop:1166 length:354 start_codon:yes stop_codon:yes gene_type:complete